MNIIPVVEPKKTNNYKKRVILTLISIFVLINFIFLIAGNYFYNIVINWNKTNNYAIGYAGEVAEGAFDSKRFNSLKKEYVSIDSRYGYKLSGIFIKNATPTKNTVILVHGIGQDKWNSLKYGDIFLDEGYNIFIYDSRNHGESGGKHPSYGYFEKDDLQTCVKYIKNKIPGGIIGIHGESLGAATTMLYAETYVKDNDISFYVEDCGWSDLRKLYILKSADYKVPAFLRPILIEYLSLVCMVRSGFSLDDASPIKNIDKISKPMLFIHGDSDAFIPTAMVYDLYNKKTGIKVLYIAKGAGHASSFSVNKAKYRLEIISFLDTVFKK